MMRESNDSNTPVQTATLSKPGTEMAKVGFLIGSWNASDTYEKSRFAPNGGTGSGVYHTVPGPGGFSIVTDYHYTGSAGRVERTASSNLGS